MNKSKKIETSFDILRVFAAILIAYLVALFMLVMISDNPVYVIRQFMFGPFSTFRRFGDVITLMIPIIFTGLCMCFVYAVNQFNLVGEGAVSLGACLSACTALALADQGIPAPLLIFILLLVGACSGMVCSAIPALAERKFHANVCVISLMMNYVLLYLTLYILKYVIKDPSSAITASHKLPKEVLLPNLIPRTSVHAGLLIAVLCVIVVAVIFYKLPFGYRMRAVGLNPAFAKYIGIPVSATIVLAQMIGGAFAGMGGTVQILGMYTRYQWTSLTNYGFDGLMVAVLAKKNPALVPVGAFLIAYIRTGADIVTRTTDVPAEFVSIVQGIIIVLVAAEMFLSGFKRRMIVKTAKESLVQRKEAV